MFIVIEGVDGVGKTSVANVLYNKFKKAGRLVWKTEEPNSGCFGGHELEEMTRWRNDYDRRTLMLAFAANRIDHAHRYLRPWLLHPDAVVICDRYYLSSLVYQSIFGTADEFEPIMALNMEAPTPDITFVLNAPSNHIRANLLKRGATKREIDDALFHAGSYQKASEYLIENNEKVVGVNGARPMRNIIEDISFYLQLLKAGDFPDMLMGEDSDIDSLRERNEEMLEELDRIDKEMADILGSEGAGG